MIPRVSSATERLLRLSSLPGVGVASLRRIVEILRSPSGSSLEDGELIALSTRPSASGKQTADGWQKILDQCDQKGISILSPFDASYPRLLEKIVDYPPILYVKGNIAALENKAAAVVGTREASKLGLSWAGQIAKLFVDHNFSVVSGLALGVDTAAHEGALRGSGITIAILAHGLDQVTPASNRGLAEQILENEGALVAEHPPGVPPRRAEYVRRNRIQSGMSMCSVVVESAETGGAIHQGNFTHQQGRVLFCVLPDQSVAGAEEFKTGGAHTLMREVNAIPLRSRADLLAHLDRMTSSLWPTSSPLPPEQGSLL